MQQKKKIKVLKKSEYVELFFFCPFFIFKI